MHCQLLLFVYESISKAIVRSRKNFRFLKNPKECFLIYGLSGRLGDIYISPTKANEQGFKDSSVKKSEIIVWQNYWISYYCYVHNSDIGDNTMNIHKCDGPHISGIAPVKKKDRRQDLLIHVWQNAPIWWTSGPPWI